MSHVRRPHTDINPRSLSAYEQRLLSAWHQHNLQLIKDLDQEIQWAIQNGGSTVLSRFASNDPAVLSTAQAVKRSL